MKKLIMLLGLMVYALPAAALELDTPIVPEKNMTKGGLFSSPEEIPALEGDITAIKEAKKVFVPYFKVKFEKVMHSNASSESGNWRSSATVSMHANVETTGYKEEVLQKITDLAYDDLVSQLKSKGFDVVSREDAKDKSNVMQDKLKAAKKDFPNIDEDESVYVATNTGFPDSWLAPLLPDGSLSMPPSDLANDMEVGIVVVGYELSYVNVSKKETSSFTGASVEMSLGPVANVGGFMQVLSDDEMHKLSMGQLAYSEIPFGKFEETTSTGTKVALAGVAVLGALMGSGSSMDITDYTLTVDEAKFVEASVDALKKANAIFIDTL